MLCLSNIIGKFVASGRHRSTPVVCMQEQHLTMWEPGHALLCSMHDVPALSPLLGGLAY